MQIIQAFVTQNKCYQAGAPLTPRGIMLHSVGTPQPSARALVRYMDQYQPGGQSVCVHARRAGGRHGVSDAAVGDARLALRRER